MKKEDFILVTVLDGKKVYGLRPDYFKEKPMEEMVKEAMEEKKEVEIIIEPEPEIEVPIPEPTEEELAELEEIDKALVAKQEAEIEKEKKKAELKAQLEALG